MKNIEFSRYLKTEEVSCIICEKKSKSDTVLKLPQAPLRLLNNFYFIDLGYKICRKCGLIYMSPRLTDAALQLYYQYSYQFISSQHSFQKATINYIFTNINNLHKTTILDVGCNDGAFLNEFYKRGYPCLGIEPSIKSVNFIKKKYPFLSVIPKMFEMCLSELKRYSFSLIAFVETFEHLLNPVSVLKQLNELKFKYLYIQIPNSYGELYPRMTKEYGHLFYYTRNTLGKLLFEHGFDIHKFHDNNNEKPTGAIRVVARKRTISMSCFYYNPQSEYEFMKTKIKNVHKRKQEKTKKLKKDIKKLIKEVKNKKLRVGLFGAGTDALFYIKELEPVKKQIVAVFDSNRILNNKLFLNKYIILPITRIEKNEVDLIIITLIDREKKVFSYIKNNIDSGIKIWPDIMERT